MYWNTSEVGCYMLDISIAIFCLGDISNSWLNISNYHDSIGSVTAFWTTNIGYFILIWQNWVRTWTNNYIRNFLRDVIILPRSNLKGGTTKPNHLCTHFSWWLFASHILFFPNTTINASLQESIFTIASVHIIDISYGRPQFVSQLISALASSLFAQTDRYNYNWNCSFSQTCD